jgi:hypothetical protein
MRFLSTKIFAIVLIVAATSAVAIPQKLTTTAQIVSAANAFLATLDDGQRLESPARVSERQLYPFQINPGPPRILNRLPEWNRGL